MNVKPLRIAIADDEVDMRDFLCKILPRLGHEVVSVAENGPQLVAACRQTHPDLIITDLKMPGGDGLTAVEEIWCEQPVPVIMISAYPQEVAHRLLANELLAAILIKPVRTADLQPVIDRVAAKYVKT